MMGYLNRLLQRVQAWFKRVPKPSHPFMLPPAPRLATGGPAQEPCDSRVAWSTPTLVEGQRQSDKAKRRHELELARLARDKMVTPHGPEPVKHERVTKTPPDPQPAPPPPVMLADPNDILITGELVEGDGQGDVLFNESEFYGEFNFRDSILEQLDRYWVYIARMKKYDAQSYEFYKRLGATLIPYSANSVNFKLRNDFHKLTPQEVEEYKSQIVLPPWFKQHRPSFGCIALGTNPLTEERELSFRDETDRKLRLWTPKFMYFIKYSKPPPEFQPMTGGDFYKLTIWWDKPQDHTLKGEHGKWGTPQDIGFFINKDGTQIHLLRTCKTEMVRVGKKGNNRIYKLIPERAWRFPRDYVKWAEEYGLDVCTHLALIFVGALKHFERSNFAMARVSVTKGDLTACFGVDPHRIPYFFQDRDIRLTAGGYKERAFHFVAPHVRADGTPVKAHFRGAREFEWAGYHVLITVPGLHHVMLPEFDVGVMDDWWIKKKSATISTTKLAKILDRNIHGKRLRMDK